jgi:phosphoribosyl-AMP cyclohydrolase
MNFKPDFTKMNGLIPVITQDWQTREVLMVAFMNEEAWDKTLSIREAVYYSRSRNKLWHKGETSGNIQKIKDILIDCDNDTAILLVEQVGGAACHTGFNSCFFRKIDFSALEKGSKKELLINLPKERIFDPKKVYGKSE